MQVHRFLVASLVYILSVSVTLATEDPSEKAGKNPEKQPPIAKSHDELGQLVSAAIDKEDYETIQKLMAPVAVLKEMGAPEEYLKAYSEYVAEVPKLAERYRAHLNDEGLLPLAGKGILKHKSTEQDRQKVNEKTIERSTGIRLVDKQGEIILELVDDAVAIDGRWYITRLCTDRIEEKLNKDAANK